MGEEEGCSAHLWSIGDTDTACCSKSDQKDTSCQLLDTFKRQRQHQQSSEAQYQQSRRPSHLHAADIQNVIAPSKAGVTQNRNQVTFLTHKNPDPFLLKGNYGRHKTDWKDPIKHNSFSFFFNKNAAINTHVFEVRNNHVTMSSYGLTHCP